MKLSQTLKVKAPRFCKYVRKVHVFRMEEWSDVTNLIASKDNQVAGTAMDVDEEIEQDELTD